MTTATDTASTKRASPATGRKIRLAAADAIFVAINKHKKAHADFLLALLNDGAEQDANVNAGRGLKASPKTEAATRRAGEAEQRAMNKLIQTAPTTSTGLCEMLDYLNQIGDDDEVLHSNMPSTFINTIRASVRGLFKAERLAA